MSNLTVHELALIVAACEWHNDKAVLDIMESVLTFEYDIHIPLPYINFKLLSLGSIKVAINAKGNEVFVLSFAVEDDWFVHESLLELENVTCDHSSMLYLNAA